MPVVSILMVTYNRAVFIPRAIESVTEQTYQDWELIIVDDGSTDTTAKVVEPFLMDKRIRYISRVENRGIVASRNEALAYAGGTYVAILDSDDEWHDPSKLEKQVELCEKGNYILVGTGVVYIDVDGKKLKKEIKPETDKEIRNFFLYKNPFVHSSVLFVREKALEIGGYHNFEIGEDYEFLLRLGTLGKMYCIPAPMVKYRVHAANTSGKKLVGLSENMRIVRLFKKKYPYYHIAFFRRWIRYMIGKCIL